jgi:flagellar biosynthesis protein FlhG
VKGRGEIVALSSSKGGVGKTHLSVGLSAALARRHSRVLVIDADLGNGIVADRLGFYPKSGLIEFFSKEKNLEDLIERTPHGFYLIGGERGNLSLANPNYLQKIRFLRSFVKISREFDFVVLDLSSGITRQVVDFALIADRAVVVTSPNDLISAFGWVQAAFSRFVQLETRLSKRLEGYKTRSHFRPLVLLNQVRDLSEGKSSFEALESTVENRLAGGAFPFQIRLDYLGSVFRDVALFKKAEERRCPAPTLSVYSGVAFCVDSIANLFTDPTPTGGFDREKRIHYTFQMLMEQQSRLRHNLKEKVKRVYPARQPLEEEEQSVSP